MSKPKTITIDEVEYVRADSIKQPVGPPTEKRIIVADRGWVFIGDCIDDEVGVTISDAKCIRIWGTDNERPGLGWLALNGPTEKTCLDPYGTVRIPTRSLVASLDVNEGAWS